jgi:hypothetical protein
MRFTKPDEDDPLEKEFQQRCNRVSKPDQWLINPVGDTDFEKGVRRGIEIVVLSIRDTHGEFDLWPQENGSYWLDLDIYEDGLIYREDFAKLIRSFINRHGGDDDDIHALSAYLRAQADEVDKAIREDAAVTALRKYDAEGGLGTL